MEEFERLLALFTLVLQIEVLMLAHLNLGMRSILIDTDRLLCRLCRMEHLQEIQNTVLKVAHISANYECLLSTIDFLIMDKGFMLLKLISDKSCICCSC